MAAARKPPNAGKGRIKGTPNKITADLREMIEGALADLGGRAWLIKAADEKPAAFLALIGKLLPKDIIIDKRIRDVSELTREELLAIAARGRAGTPAKGSGSSDPSEFH